ncbi:hypothetical protein ACOMHN_006954 [Nucella lapillus]
MAEGGGFRARELLKEARQLRELFKGRFSEEESLELLRTHDTLGDAVDFVLNGDPAEIRKLINDRNEALVDSLRRDTEYVNAALQQGLAATKRLFACGPCDKYWWRKVPARKEVSKCKSCKVKYDPVPQHEEWGLGEFVCVCGHIFYGSAWMNHTESPCYKCGFHASPRQILPPTRPHEQKDKRAGHSCTGGNCYNRAQGAPPFSSELQGRISQEGGKDKEEPVCPHEQSVKGKRVLHPSQLHASTGSTVDTFMSQGSLTEDYQELLPMPAVPEVDED